MVGIRIITTYLYNLIVMLGGGEEARQGRGRQLLRATGWARIRHGSWACANAPNAKRAPPPDLPTPSVLPLNGEAIQQDADESVDTRREVQPTREPELIDLAAR